MPCQYCPSPNTIEHSHVASDFIIRYCMPISTCQLTRPTNEWLHPP
jgi:hypothetical protein